MAAYWLAGLVLTLSFAALHDIEWRGSNHLHTNMEIIATVLALIVGVMALVRFYSKKDNTFLFVGAGFLGTALLDGYHAIVTSEAVQHLMPSGLPSLLPWSWVASRLFLSVMVFLSWYCWQRSQRLGPGSKVSESTVYLFSAVFTLTCFLFFAFVPLPVGYTQAFTFHRPEEFVPALFFLLALIGYLKKGRWREDAFEHWLIISLIAGLISQAVFMSHSGQLFDYEFDIAHLLKKISYICVLVGLLLNMHSIFRNAEEGEGRFQGAIESLQEAFAFYDSKDRLAIYNDEFLRLHSGLGDVIKTGMPFEDLIRASAERGLVKEAIGNKSEFIRRRMKQHRNPVGPILRELTDGTWYIINEARTPDGGVSVTQTDITELKDAERALRDREALTRRILEASPVGVLIVTREGQHLFANERALEIQGVTREELFGSDAGSYYADSGLRTKLKDDLYETGSTPPTEVELVKPDGEHFFVILSSTLTEFEGRKAHLTYMYDVTALKQAENDVRTARDFLIDAIESIEGGVALFDREDRLVLFNKKYRNLLPAIADIMKPGVTFERMLRQLVMSGNYLDEDAEEGAFIQMRLQRHREAQGVEAYKLADGRWLQVDEYRTHEGGILLIVLDITERKQAEQDLQESQARLKAIIDTVPALINLKDRDGRYVMTNRYHSEFFGLEPDALIGKTSAALSKEHGEHMAEINRAVMEKGETSPPYDYQMKDGKGRVRDLLTTKVPLKDLSGEIIGVVSTSIDITERKRASEALRQSEARTRTIVDNAIDGIITIDERGAIHSVNPAAETIFGFTEDELIGQNINMLAAEPYRSAHDRYLANYLTTGDPKIIGSGKEVEGERKNGRRFPMDLSVTEVFLDDERMFVGIVRDITERKAMDRMKSEFISTVSHELRTPLTSIRGSLGLITGGAVGKVSKNARELIDMAEQNTERLINLVNDILDMEKIESGSMEFRFAPVDLSALVEQAIKTNKGYAEEHGVEFVLTRSGPGVTVRGDKDRLTQVLANLLSNAAKFSPEGEKVEVAVTLNKKIARVSVSDRGPGIPEDFHDNVFAKFTQADSSDTRQVGGTGLGLNISKTIVEKHGGNIGFDTSKDGTTFYFDLSITDAKADAIIPPSATVREGARILICEDDRDIANLLSMVLEQNGYVADIARNAAQARELLNNKHYDAMTLDLMLPDEDGISLFRSLREDENTRDLPVIVVSVAADERRGELMGGEAVGVVDWLAKPIDQTRLLDAVMGTLSSSSGRPRILYVEDDKDIVFAVSRLLEEVTEVIAAGTVEEAKGRLLKDRFDLAIIDIGLPDGSGLDLLPLLGKDGVDATPVIIFSGEDVTSDVAAEVNSVLVKSNTSNEKLLATIRSCIAHADSDEE